MKCDGVTDRPDLLNKLLNMFGLYKLHVCRGHVKRAACLTCDMFYKNFTGVKCTVYQLRERCQNHSVGAWGLCQNVSLLMGRFMGVFPL